MSLKALSKAFLKDNQQRNQSATMSCQAKEHNRNFSQGSATQNKPTEPELFNLLGREMEEIDRAGRPWTGFYKSLSLEQRQTLKEINRRIDDTYEALDRDGLMAALVEYREFCISNRSLH